MSTALLDPAVETVRYTNYDRSRVAHYIAKNRYITGLEVEALCGYVWIPTRSPSGLPICQQCKAIYDDPDAIADAHALDYAT